MNQKQEQVQEIKKVLLLRKYGSYYILVYEDQNGRIRITRLIW